MLSTALENPVANWIELLNLIEQECSGCSLAKFFWRVGTLHLIVGGCHRPCWISGRDRYTTLSSAGPISLISDLSGVHISSVLPKTDEGKSQESMPPQHWQIAA